VLDCIRDGLTHREYDVGRFDFAEAARGRKYPDCVTGTAKRFRTARKTSGVVLCDALLPTI
jgi:hypothetical protein